MAVPYETLILSSCTPLQFFIAWLSPPAGGWKGAGRRDLGPGIQTFAFQAGSYQELGKDMVGVCMFSCVQVVFCVCFLDVDRVFGLLTP